MGAHHEFMLSISPPQINLRGTMAAVAVTRAADGTIVFRPKVVSLTVVGVGEAEEWLLAAGKPLLIP
jgi:hypothetical protein